MSSPFAVTTPTPEVVLAENRLLEVPFTVSNASARTVRGRAVPVALDATPKEWLSVVGAIERDFPVNETDQIVVRVEPPLGVPAGTYPFRLDMVGVERPDEDYTEGAGCAVEVPATEIKMTTPKGYLATLVGATVGGLVGELVIVVSALLSGDSSSRSCTDAGCVLGDAFASAFALVIAIFFAVVLMWVGSVIGAWAGLRVRRYLGAKTTALFLAILIIPWTLLAGALIGQVVGSLVLAAILAPLLLIAVPAVIARAAVLLIRTHHI